MERLGAGVELAGDTLPALVARAFALDAEAVVGAVVRACVGTTVEARPSFMANTLARFAMATVVVVEAVVGACVLAAVLCHPSNFT